MRKLGRILLLSVYMLLSLYPAFLLIAHIATGGQASYVPLIAFFGGSLLLGFAMSGFIGRRGVILQWILAALAIAGVGTWLFHPMGWGVAFFVVVGALGFSLCHGMGRESSLYSLPPLIPFVGVLLYFALYVFTYFLLELAPLRDWLNPAAGAYLILEAYFLSGQGVSQAANGKQGQGRAARPLKRGSLILTTGFVAVMAAVLNWGALRDGVGNGLRWLLQRFLDFLHWIGNLFYHDSSGAEDWSPGYDPFENPGAQAPPEAANPFWDKVWEIAATVFVVIFALALLAVLVYAIYRLVKFLIPVIKRYLSWYQGEGVEFQDEEQDLFSWDDVRKEAGERMQRFAKRFARRERWGDYGDERQRLRYLYRQVLRRSDDPERRSRQTPLQLAASDPLPGKGEAVAGLAEAYNAARYSAGRLPEGTAAALRERLE